MKTLNVKKGQLIQSKGDLNNKVYSVESGLLRSYTIDNKGKEHIYMFAPGNWIIADSNEADVPCELFIDAIEDSVLQVTEKNDLLQNNSVKPLMKRIATLQNRIIMLMSSTAIQRYEHFVETYPDIIQRVPQKMIASYLGITPEALSKVKGEKARGK